MVGAINYAADDYESLFGGFQTFAIPHRTNSILGSGGLARECVPFKCPKGKEAVPKRPLKLEAKGGCDRVGQHVCRRPHFSRALSRLFTQLSRCDRAG